MNVIFETADQVSELLRLTNNVIHMLTDRLLPRSIRQLFPSTGLELDARCA